MHEWHERHGWQERYERGQERGQEKDAVASRSLRQDTETKTLFELRSKPQKLTQCRDTTAKHDRDVYTDTHTHTYTHTKSTANQSSVAKEGQYKQPASCEREEQGRRRDSNAAEAARATKL